MIDKPGHVTVGGIAARLSLDYRVLDSLYRRDNTFRDPDSYSERLNEHHRVLWRKCLPSGPLFDLQPGGMRGSLVLTYNGVEYSSDGLVTSFYFVKKKLGRVRDDVEDPTAMETAMNRAYSIGGFGIWPKGKKANPYMGINTARGTNSLIADRLDLTLECVRRFYIGESSPLAKIFGHHRYFFDLFVDFRSFVEFFLLDDILDGDDVRFWLPFDGFGQSAYPKSEEQLRSLWAKSGEFLDGRDRRVAEVLARLVDQSDDTSATAL
jgi:hypothetical protein